MTSVFRILILSFTFILYSCGNSKTAITETPNFDPVQFEINLLDRSNDTYKVTVIPPTLTKHNTIYQFASTAPGTYQVMDIGRYVKAFKAFDKNGNELDTQQISTNQFQLTSPEKITKIEYQISETWDTPVSENQIYLMCGTSLENDHTLINGQAVFGYFKDKQNTPITIKLNYPDTWSVGTPLSQNSKGLYVAEDYDKVVDSPILLGNLTKASMDVQGTKVDIYTYSKTGLITSNQVLKSMENMLLSASGFLNGLPVKNYTFLFHFEDKTNGAWEHSYSSEYIYREDKWENVEQQILEVAAHEFFHVVTPLNIHSEIVDQFNFITPVPSRHLWLYEGTTEWASHMMLFRSGLKSTNDYFKTLSRKIMVDSKYFDPKVSLEQLSLTSYTKAGNKQYGNIYMRGALVAGLIDIKLLELSNGKRGYIDVINDLAKEYGPDKPFNDATFFDTFVKKTYPEIQTIIDQYIVHANPLPLQEYYNKIGITYNPETNTFSLNESPTTTQLNLRNKWMAPISL
ncbi:peptidase [Formosa sediminum]|uniref:Peptidase n=1 Tax=Formosa sediminum TaxID=2594004 RepID=A0A516GVN8_9FLAO|nr:peptidase [Formosa sediminum]QDO95582.1 peptidase [Formosa sediminum]